MSATYPRFTLEHLLNTRVYLTDRRRALGIVVDRLENANNTYSHPQSLDELRQLEALLVGLDAIGTLVEADIADALKQMDVPK